MPKPGSVLTQGEKISLALPLIVFIALSIFGLYLLFDHFIPLE